MTADLDRGGQPDPSHWTLADLGLDRVERHRVSDDWLTYYLVAAASFVETAAALYTSNLVEHFPDPRAREWLAKRWQVEELQHGRALRAYVEAVWPDLDWERGYAGFYDEYSRMCTMEELEDSRALEMAARCVVETGTATFYTTLHNRAQEPVLKKLTGFIRQDEVRHYNYFRSFYRTYKAEEKVGRWSILRALRQRFAEAEQEDAYVGFKHAWLIRHPGQPFADAYFADFMRQVREIVKLHYPHRMAVQMLLQPLDLNRALQRILMPVLVLSAKGLMFR